MNASIDISNTIITTERLIIRPFLPTDLDDFYEYAKVEGVGERAGWAHHKSKRESRKILESFIDEKCVFAITYNYKVIGSIGLVKYNENLFKNQRTLFGREVGFALSMDYWGRGIMTEALKAVIDYSFNTLKYDFLVCTHNTSNVQSERVQKKCGFKTLFSFTSNDIKDKFGSNEFKFNIIYNPKRV